jgi:elongation factor Ts
MAMPEITAALVKDLREKTGAGMMDCKKALTETGGEIEPAVDWLRKKGLAAAAKRSGRVAAEGLIGVASAPHRAAMVEVNAETDFVARNAMFQAAALATAEAALDAGADIDAISAAKTKDGETVGDMITGLIGTIGENMRLRRAAHFAVSAGAVAAYVHNQTAPGLGRIGVLVAVEGEGDQAVLSDLGRRIAMHVAATSPKSLSPDDLDQADIEHEKAIFTEQALESGKPANVVEKMVEGRIRKWMEEVVLLKQAYVKNPDQTIEQLVAETAKAVGSPVKVVGFVRLALGEGVEKKDDDFAAEVAAMTKPN